VLCLCGASSGLRAIPAALTTEVDVVCVCVCVCVCVVCRHTVMATYKQRTINEQETHTKTLH